MFNDRTNIIRFSWSFRPIHSISSIFSDMLSLCNPLYEGGKKQKNHKIYLYVYNSACAEVLLQLGRCFDLCQTSFICRKSEFRLTFEVAPIEVQRSSSCIHIFPVDQSIKYELKRMLQDKSNGTVMNLS